MRTSPVSNPLLNKTLLRCNMTPLQHLSITGVFLLTSQHITNFTSCAILPIVLKREKRAILSKLLTIVSHDSWRLVQLNERAEL